MSVGRRNNCQEEEGEWRKKKLSRGKRRLKKEMSKRRGRLDEERGKRRLIGEITVKKKREIGIRKDCEEEEGD